MEPRVSSLVHRLDDTTYALDYSASNNALPALDLHAVANAMLADTIDVIRDGAGLSMFKRELGISKQETDRRKRINRRVRDLEDAVAWINGGDAVVPFALACILTDRDPVSTRRGMARSLGLNVSEPGALIVGPFTQEHAKTAAQLIQASLEVAPALDSSQAG